jgi:hypothetical protein
VIAAGVSRYDLAPDGALLFCHGHSHPRHPGGAGALRELARDELIGGLTALD